MSPATITAAQTSGTRKDYLFGILAGFIIGILLLPVLKTANPNLYSSIYLMVIPFFVVLTPIGLVVASWVSKRLSFAWQLAKFAVIGGMNMLVDLGVLTLLSAFALNSAFAIAPEDPWFIVFTFTVTYYSLYKACSFVAANVNSYFWNRNWTFEATDTKKAGTEFMEFFLVSFIGFIINVIIASFVFTTFHLVGGLSISQWGLVGALAGSAVGLAWNFIGYKFLVFKK